MSHTSLLGLLLLLAILAVDALVIADMLFVYMFIVAGWMTTEFC